jgi:hypothetical protein
MEIESFAGDVSIFPNSSLAVSALVHEDLTLLATQFAVVERFLFVKEYPDCSILNSSEV